MPAPRKLEPGTVQVAWYLKPERIRQVRAESAITGVPQSKIVDDALENYFGKTTLKSIRNVMPSVASSQR